MPDTKITGYSELTAPNVASGDMLEIADVSQGAADAANMKISVPSILKAGLSLNPIGLMPDFRISGLYHGPDYNATNQTLSLNTSGREYYVAIQVFTRFTLASLAVMVTTSGAGNVKLGVHECLTTSDGGMKVGNVVAQGSAAVSLNGGVGVVAATVSPAVVLEPGLYFLSLIGDGGGGAAIRGIAAGFGSLWSLATGATTTALAIGYYRAGTYATGLVDMTSLTPAGTLSGLGSNTPLIGMRP